MSRLRRDGLPVPDGFVVPAGSMGDADPGLRALLRQVAAVMDEPNPPHPETLLRRFPGLEAEAVELQRELDASVKAWRHPVPRWFIVRSSATHEDGDSASFAGVLESFPAVRRPHLAAAVLLCRAAAYRRRALAYCKQNGVDPAEVAVAVVVQEMIPARASGVLLTRDPVSGERALVINAVYGLGAALVNGEADPDSYRRREDGTWETRRGDQYWKEVLTKRGVRRRRLTSDERRQAVLTPAELEALADLGERVERGSGTPQDLEWAIEGERLWLLQARPITTLPEPSGTWTRANLIELYPEVVSPMTASLIERLQGRWLVDYFLRCGFDVAHLGPGIRIIRGRPYLNQTLLHYLSEAAGADPERVHEDLGGGSGASGSRPWDWRRALHNAAPLLRLLRRYFTAPGRAPAVLRRAAQEAAERRPRQDLSDLQFLAGALACFRAQRPLADLTADVAGSIHILRGLAETLLRGSGESLSQALGADDSASTALARELDALIDEARSDPRTASMILETGELSAALLRRLEDTRVGKQFDRFLTRHGARALYESDSAVPRYREDPTPLLYALRRGLEEAPSGNVAAVEPAQPDPPTGETRQPLRAVLGRALLRRLGRLYALRQDVRAGIVSLIAAQRCWELALGERWAARGWLDEPADYFMLTLADAERAASAPGPEPARWLRERLARNRARQEEWAATPMPLTWTDDASPQVAAPLPNADAAELLRGIPISPGVADGCVAVLRHAEEARTIPPGAILVAPQAGPAWAPLYTRAAGLVVEVGGVLSHGSILAREYGLPAVANIAGITAVLRDGEWVRVDGSRGVVYRLDGAPEHPSAGPEQSASDQYAGIDEDEWDEEEADEWSETRRW